MKDVWAVIGVVILFLACVAVVVSLFAGAAKISMQEGMEHKDELPPAPEAPRGLPYQPALVRPYVADEEYRLELTEPMVIVRPTTYEGGHYVRPERS